MYQRVWKCRLCGQRFIGEVGLTNNDVAALLCDKEIAHRTLFHQCYGNSVGMADFQGFEHYGDKDVE